MNDNLAQIAWLEHVSGLKFEVLFAACPALYNSLAAEWRANHPL